MKRNILTPIRTFFCFMLCGLFVFGFRIEASALTFKDVPSNHWAYDNISSVSDQGLMIGDFEGYFKPDDYIDKFDASILIARIVGYDSNASAEELAEYERIENKWGQMISTYSSQFTRWKHNATPYIAYLLEFNILTEADLGQFVIVIDNKERLRALTREEMAVMLVRALDKEGSIHEVVGKAFNDDKDIDAVAKPYVYYLQATGIIAGDTNNNYNPKSAIQRSAMARVVDLAYEKIKMPDVSDPRPDASNYQTFTGEIAQVFAGMNAIQISSDTIRYDSSIKTMSSNVTIKVDGYIATFKDLKIGMFFTAVMDEYKDEIVSISALSTGKPDNTNKDKDKDTDREKDDEIPSNLLVINAVLDRVKEREDADYIDVEIRILNIQGDITKEIRTFEVFEFAEIRRGNERTTLLKAKEGENVTISYKGDIAYKLHFEEEEGEIEGYLRNKSFDGDNQFISVEDRRTKEVYRYKITKDTTFSRNGRRYLSLGDLRIGDEVLVYTTYGNAEYVEASGERTSKDVTVESIYFSGEESYIMGKGRGGEVEKYMMNLLSASEFEKLRVGSLVRLRLDSDEVDSFTILEDVKQTSYTGTIERISRNTFDLSEDRSSVTKEITFDERTKVINARTGKSESINYLSRGMKVYVVTSSSNSKYAEVISILDDY